MTGLLAHHRSFATYNAWANARLYAAVAELSDAARWAQRSAAYFGSIAGTLNHLLVVDRLWMDRIEHLPPAGYALDSVLFEDFEALRAARVAEDDRIQAFVNALGDADMERRVAYRTSRGEPHSDSLSVLLAHMFNHATHHRGQCHALLKESGQEPPPLDYIYYCRAAG